MGSELDQLAETLRAAHARFTDLVATIRPELHRYCARMTGSVLDGEDLVQETLAQACYGLPLLREEVALRPWLFTIAHHKCVDFLRRRSQFPSVELDEGDATVEPQAEIEDRRLASQALSGILLHLPPRERGALLLKDVLGHSLEECAKILDTTVGGVKAALHRGREKLSGLRELPVPRAAPLPADVQRYMEVFGRRDWEALSSLLAEEVQCEVVGHAQHNGRASLSKRYLSNYATLPFSWSLVSGTVDGEPVIVCLREGAPRHAVRLEWRGGQVVRIRDYVGVSYLLRDARVVLD